MFKVWRWADPLLNFYIATLTIEAKAEAKSREGRDSCLNCYIDTLLNCWMMVRLRQKIEKCSFCYICRRFIYSANTTKTCPVFDGWPFNDHKLLSLDSSHHRSSFPCSFVLWFPCAFALPPLHSFFPSFFRSVVPSPHRSFIPSFTRSVGRQPPQTASPDQ